MANEEQLSILKQGVDVWNEWRKANVHVHADLSTANLRGTDLRAAKLRGVDLIEKTNQVRTIEVTEISASCGFDCTRSSWFLY